MMRNTTHAVHEKGAILCEDAPLQITDSLELFWIWAEIAFKSLFLNILLEPKDRWKTRKITKIAVFNVSFSFENLIKFKQNIRARLILNPFSVRIIVKCELENFLW